MVIHNLSEDTVNETINELFDREEQTHKLGFCTCFQCRLDVACYALNRIKSEYVISGRGIAHGENAYGEKLQKAADVVTVIHEGWSRIDHTRRPHFQHIAAQVKPILPQGSVYNFPSIIGRLFNGSNFEPLSGVQIGLYVDGELVRMIDPNWQNPASLVGNTAGTFIFWPYPEEVASPGKKKSYSYQLTAQVPGFEDFSHFFEIELVSDQLAIDQFSLQRVHKLPDLCIFPK